MHTLLLLALLGCGGQTGENGDLGCEPVYTATTAEDSTLGFSAEDVFAMLDDAPPVEVVWTEMTQKSESADISLVLTADGDPELAEPGGETSACAESGTWLRVPVRMEISLAGGEVTASGSTHLDVGALDLSRVGLSSDWDLPAELSGEYATQFAAYFEAEYASRGFSLDSTWITFADTWAEPVFDIEFKSTSADSGSAATAWRGTWTLP